jgi:hypothetical protein
MPETPAAETPATTGAPVPEGGSSAAIVDTAEFQRQIEELREQVAEGQRTAQYWAEKARGNGTTPKQAEPPAEEEPDVLEAITTGGAKGFDALASKRGFIRKAEVEELINQKAAALTKEQELMALYPDLKRKDSEFFKATAMEYGELIKAGVSQTLAMETAAQRAELAFIRSGKIKLPGSEPTKEEKEAARLARIAAQSGEGSMRRPPAEAAEDDELTPQQKHIADSMGISHEAYLKRAKAGVKMGGLR